MRFYESSLLVAFLLLVFPTTVLAGDGLPADRANQWHRFRGPEGTGLAPHANPPTVWDAETNVKWSVPIPGRGSASPIVWGNRIFLLTAIKTERTSLAHSQEAGSKRVKAQLAVGKAAAAKLRLAQGPPPPEGEDRPRRRRRGFFGFGKSDPTNVHQYDVICLDRETGKTLWQQTACEAIPHEGHHGTASFASASPVTDGTNLYVSFGSRGIYSYNVEGEFRWKYDVGRLRMRNSFGEGASPALYGDTLVINCDQEDQSFIVALDTDSGKERWRVNRDEATSWTTPYILEHSGKTQVVVNGSNRVRSYDLNSGELIWECGGQAMNPVATPVVFKDLGIFMTGRRGFAAQAISLDARGDVTDSDKVAWQLDDGTPYVPSPLLSANRLYFTKSLNAILTCVSAETGEIHYKNQRIEGIRQIYSSLVGADGRVYISGRDGKTVVLKDGTDYEVLATNDIGETIDATLAIVGNELFIRGEKKLYCIAEE